MFHPTPIISAYLVALHVSDFVETELTSTDARPFKVISRPGVLNQHKWAAETGVRITNELDDYLAILYHEMGQGVLMKNYHIAVPDFKFGAMENWGMVNYRYIKLFLRKFEEYQLHPITKLLQMQFKMSFFLLLIPF